jgi:tetratricopeptide (TPR) repeat protein
MGRHLSRLVLIRLFSDPAPGPAEEAVRHLHLCPQCRDRATGVMEELKRTGALVRTADACDAVLILLEDEKTKGLDRLRARAAWADLKPLPPRQQLGRIQTAPELLTLQMFTTVVEDAAGTALEDPHLGEEIALVAHALADVLPEHRYPRPFRHDYQSEAMGLAGNCRRLAGNWRGTAEAFAKTRNHLEQGTGDPLRKARFLSLQASLASDTGHLEQALALLERASALYRGEEDFAAAVSIEIQAASSLLAAGRHEEAIARAAEALGLLTPGQARLEMVARNIIIECLVFLDRPAEALRTFLATQPLYKKLWSQRTELQTDYLEGLLLDGLGCAREAEQAFRNNIANCRDAELYKDAFLTQVTLLQSHFRKGALDKAVETCKEAIDVIERTGAGCHSQMTELWRDLLALLAAGRLTEHHLLIARHYLARHWNVPARQAPLELAVVRREALLLATHAPGMQPRMAAGQPAALPAPAVTDLAHGGYEEARESYDRALIAAGLAACGGSVRATAHRLGISRNTLRRKLRRHGLAAGEPEPLARAELDAAGREEEIKAVRLLRARAGWTELKALPHGRRLDRIRSVSALQTCEMVEVLIEDASRVALREPHQGEKTALLAHHLAGLLPPGRCPEAQRNDLQGTAMLIVMSCRRLAGDWEGSAAALGAARSHRDQGSGDRALEARFLTIQASLAADTWCFDEALAFLARAGAIYRTKKDRAGLVAVTVQEASTHMAAGRHEEAVARAKVALCQLPPGEARLELLARNIVTESLVFLGRPAEALRSLLASLPLYEQLRELRTELQLGYLEALLLEALGYAKEAKRAFRNNIAALMEAELYKDAFLTMMTRFEALFRRGDLTQAARACEEAIEEIEQAGEDWLTPMKELWRGILTLVDARRLAESHLLEARHCLVRGSAGRGGSSMASLPPWVTGKPALEAASPPPTAEAEPPRPALPSPGTQPALLEPPDPAASLAEVGYEQALERYDRQLVAAALAQCKGRIGDTCRLLRLSPAGLRAKLQRY